MLKLLRDRDQRGVEDRPPLVGQSDFIALFEKPDGGLTLLRPGFFSERSEYRLQRFHVANGFLQMRLD